MGSYTLSIFYTQPAEIFFAALTSKPEGLFSHQKKIQLTWLLLSIFWETRIDPFFPTSVCLFIFF